jgi:hypothetical protein
MILRFAPLLLVVSALAQQSQPALTPDEKEFQESMSGVTLNGHFTRQDGNALSDDKYTIDQVTKLKGDLWRFETRFTARVVIYKGQYAGTWSGTKGHGGQLFGNIVKGAQ